MSRSPCFILLGCIALGGVPGCVQKAPPMTQPVSAQTRPSGRAYLALEEIQPAPVLPAAHPDGPETRPALDAVELYARAQGEILDGHRLRAIPLLEQAVALDPGSFCLHLALADAYRGSFEYEDHSIAELETAASLEPDSLDVHLDLGRQYLAKGDAGKAMDQLRLAIQTHEYKAGAERAPEADLFLANALQQLGFDRAALQRYEQLLGRLSNRDLSHSPNPDLAYQVTDKLYTQVGDLYLRQGNPAAGLAAYRVALRDADQGHEAADPTLYARIVRALLLTGQNEDAKAEAVTGVRACRGSRDSVALLRETCRAMGQPGAACDALARLQAQDPGDKPILFALVEMLRSDHRAAEADRLLSRVADESPGDGQIVCKRAELRLEDGDLRGAARLLIEATARRPALAGELQDTWDRLLQPSDPIVRERLSLDVLRNLEVAPGAQASKAYAVSLYAARWPRKALARTALDEAVAKKPAFSPAYRERLAQMGSDASQSRELRQRQTDELCAAAEMAGNPSLAAELRGRAMLERGDDAGGAAALAEAVKAAGDNAPDPALQLAFASSYLAFGDAAEFERRARKVIADHPGFGPAYLQLHDYFWSKGLYPRAQAIASAWRDADPAGLSARLCQAEDQARLDHAQAAEVILNGLLDEFPDDPRVLSRCRAFYAQVHRLEELARLLRDRLAKRPMAFHCAQTLARIETGFGHVNEASRILDAARAASNEPDALYDLSQAYARLGQKQTAEDVLRQVLRLDPLHAGASNDLGYAWAEQGKNLAEAEALARVAVKVDPDNCALLDSLGWVLYKRGRFAEARATLEQAVGADFMMKLTGGDTEAAAKDDQADPVVLDHLGDVMYRLQDVATAGKLWERSWARLSEIAGPSPADADEVREEFGPLRLHLQLKQRQLKAGRPVSVAPVAEPAAIIPQTAPATRSARAGE